SQGQQAAPPLKPGADSGFHPRPPPNAIATYVRALKIGFVVGAPPGAPPARSSVTATTAFRGTVPLRLTVARAPPGNRPARRGAAPVGITKASQVLPGGALERPSARIVALPFPRTTTVKTCCWLDWLRDTAKPTTMHAAAAAATASPRATQRRRRSGTTLD